MTCKPSFLRSFISRQMMDRSFLPTTDGQPKVILGESQYLILEDGLLIITDELAQNTLNSLSVLGSFRSSDFTFPDAVSSSSGDIIETSSQQPVWSGDRPTFQSLGVETYELAQNNSRTRQGLKVHPMAPALVMLD